jgi:hypothetical protein
MTAAQKTCRFEWTRGNLRDFSRKSRMFPALASLHIERAPVVSAAGGHNMFMM